MDLLSIVAPLVALVVAVLAGFGLRWSGKRAGKSEAEADRHADTLERIEKGRRAVDRDDTPDQRVRDNDGQW